MGIFYEMVEVINRTSKPLTGRFDGQDITLLPNYEVGGGEMINRGANMVPRVAVGHLKHQNPLMNSEDPLNPRAYTSLIGWVASVRKGEKQTDDLSYLEQDETALTRVNREEFEDDRMIRTKVRGRKKHSSYQALTPQNPELQIKS